MGMAYASTLAPGETFTTLELKINFLRPVWNGTLVAAGHVVQSGKTVGLTECDVTDDGGRLVARATSTCMTLRGVKKPGAMTVTSAVLGGFRKDSRTRAEAMALITGKST
jgi:acyl-CoA hydrolase